MVTPVQREPQEPHGTQDEILPIDQTSCRIVPAATPKDVVAKIGHEVDRIMALPEMKEKLDAAGMERLTMPADKFESLMKADMDKFGKIIKAANVKLD